MMDGLEKQLHKNRLFLSRDRLFSRPAVLIGLHLFFLAAILLADELDYPAKVSLFAFFVGDGFMGGYENPRRIRRRFPYCLRHPDECSRA
nr:hypothetical protein [Planococcus glaciei]